MKKIWRTGLVSLLLFLSILGITVFSSPTKIVMASSFDNAVTFYNNYNSDIVFKDGYFYYATKGKASTVNRNTTNWGTIGYRMKVTTSSQSTYIYFNLSGYTVERVSEISSGGYIYDLCRINLSYVKSKLAQTNSIVYNEFIINGGYLVVDSCMITIKIDNYGNRTNGGSMDEYGNFRGRVYTTYGGIANAAPWDNPSSLHSYFNKTINYVTQLKSRQIVYVRYQQANGDYGSYNAVINKDYVYGETVKWSRAEDDCYNAASISYTAKDAKTSYISVTRKRYTVSVTAGTGIDGVLGGGSHYYGASATVDANVKIGYTWTNWSGTYSSNNKKYTFTVTGNVSLKANAEANTYYIVFHPNGGSGNMKTLICKYDMTYTLPVMSFVPPDHPNTYLGWNTDPNAFSSSFTEKQKIKNLTSVNGYTFNFYAIWDYAPDLAVYDRYFTLYEAQTGVITESELLRTVKSNDREDGTTKVGIKNYSASIFTRFTSYGEATITYITTDSKNNSTEKQIKVAIVDTEATKEGPIDFDGVKKYARFISQKYYLEDHTNGGLEATSKWKSEADYRATLVAAINNVKGKNGNWSHVSQNWIFNEDDISLVKQYVIKNGMGNSKSGNVLKGFLRSFSKNIIRK
ncbi:TPA: InlB B-repeat-containing protein [Clostridium sporogenes]